MATNYTYSVAITTPAANLDASNQLAAALGYGNNNFSVPLYDGTGIIIAYGLHTWASQEFVDTLTAAQAGSPPTVPGMTTAEVTGIVAQWSVSVQAAPADPAVHFDDTVSPLTREVANVPA